MPIFTSIENDHVAELCCRSEVEWIDDAPQTVQMLTTFGQVEWIAKV